MVKNKGSQTSSTKKGGGNIPSPSSSPPSWPAFKPCLPVADLAIETLVPEKVVVLRTFWPRTLCRDYVAFLSGLPLTTTPGKPRRGEALRVNDRYQIQDPQFANRLWTETGLRDALQEPNQPNGWGGEVVGLNPNIRIYRYAKGQFFDCHYDDSNNVTVTTEASEEISAKTTWTLLLYLTAAADGCVGGETVFYTHDRPTEKEAVPVAPETGMLLLHKHGDDCMLDTTWLPNQALLTYSCLFTPSSMKGARSQPGKNGSLGRTYVSGVDAMGFSRTRLVDLYRKTT